MPNWCMNRVQVFGTQEQLNAIEKASNESQLLEYFAPIGEWEYDKACYAWGTKWDVSNVSSYLDDGYLEINFDTAWGPPLEAYKTAEDRLGVIIEADYYEPGMMFIGDRDGSYELNFEEENWADNIPVELVSAWGLEDEYENYKEME